MKRLLDRIVPSTTVKAIGRTRGVRVEVTRHQLWNALGSVVTTSGEVVVIHLRAPHEYDE